MRATCELSLPLKTLPKGLILIFDDAVAVPSPSARHVLQESKGAGSGELQPIAYVMPRRAKTLSAKPASERKGSSSLNSQCMTTEKICTALYDVVLFYEHII